MTVTLALHRDARDAVGERLEAAAPGARLAVYDAGGVTVEGAAVDPATLDVDLMWLSPHVLRAADVPDRAAAMAGAFALAKGFRSLKVLETFNAGLDDPRYGELARAGVAVCNSSAQGIAIAEYVMAQVLAVMHPVERQRELQAARRWEVTPFRELSRTSWTILGHGPIGAALAVRAKAFGAEVAVVRRSPEKPEAADRVGTLADLPDLLPGADVVVVACPLNEETRGLFDAAMLARTKPGAVLVNVARGPILDEGALVAALDAGRPGVAVLDVFDAEPLPEDHPFWTHPKVRLTAHTSFAGDGTAGRWEALFLDNAARMARGEPLARRVDPRDLGVAEGVA
ncbi:MAG: NAD(P)-dependent oxidoreductase [Paracoccaceae bacterium]